MYDTCLRTVYHFQFVLIYYLFQVHTFAERFKQHKISHVPGMYKCVFYNNNISSLFCLRADRIRMLSTLRKVFTITGYVLYDAEHVEDTFTMKKSFADVGPFLNVNTVHHKKQLKVILIRVLNMLRVNQKTPFLKSGSTIL